MAKTNALKMLNGWIEVICGPMFSGKSEELLRRLNLLKYAEVSYLLFTPDIDTRSGRQKAKSRDGRVIDSISISKSRDIITELNKANNVIHVIGIDECQFFDDELPEVCNYLANNGYIVIAAGLDMDGFAKPFKTMMKLLIYAEKVTKLKAVCTVCGASASLTDTTTVRDESIQIKIGDKNEYSARCRRCHRNNNLNPHGFVKIKKIW